MENVETINPFTGSAVYQITVQGKIENALLRNLGGLILSQTRAKEKVISTLTGDVLDQPALSGILNTLIDNRYTVISVMKIE